MTHPDAVPLDQYGEPDWSMPRKAAEDTLAHPSIRGQDEADGRALRELREALPKGWAWVIESSMDGERVYALVDNAAVDVEDEESFDALGKTIAEAADACRRVLTDD